jgi:hypothetical protein
MKTSWAWAFLGVVLLLFVACGDGSNPEVVLGGSPPVSGSSSSTSSGGAIVCIPGQQLACACPGGFQGAQACLGDGSGFGTCGGCGSGEGGAAPETSSSSTSGSGGAGGQGGDGGAGGEEPCVHDPHPCGVPNQYCGDIDLGCGFVAHCDPCEDSSRYLSCNTSTHLCECTPASNDPEAVDACEPFGYPPYYCGPVGFYRGPPDCVGPERPLSNGETVACCPP